MSNKKIFTLAVMVLVLTLTACKSEINVSMIDILKKKFSGDDVSEPTTISGGLSKYYFSESTATIGKEIWVTDGTVGGTKNVKNIAEEHVSSEPRDFFKFGSKLLFTASDDAIDPMDPTSEYGIPIHGRELWITDGTGSGTLMLKDIRPGNASSSPRGFLQLGDKIIFTAIDADSIRKIWITDGTSVGTVKLSESLVVESLDFIQIMGDKLFFAGSDAVNGNELWMTDGTSAGTHLVKDLRPGAGHGDPEHFYKAGNKFFFFARDLISDYHLWITDGTDAGTIKLTNYVGADGWNWVQGVVLPNNRFVYSNYDDTDFNGLNVFVSDGTPAGSFPLTNMNGNFSEPSFTLLGDKVIFINRTAGEGREPWVTDGTLGGTFILKDINPFAGDAFNFSSFINFDRAIYFSATASDGNSKLFRTDGTAIGTTEGTIFNEGSSSSNFYLGLSEESKLFIERGSYFWTMEKNSTSPMLIQKFKDIYEDVSRNGYFEYRGTVGNKYLINYSNYDTSKLELWVTDGTDLGTIQLAIFDTPPAS